MCILKRICRFEVPTHAEYLALTYACIQEVISVSEISVVNFIVVLNQLLLEKP